MYDYHTTLNFLFIDTTEKQTNIVTSFTLIKSLAEHFNTCNNRLLILAKTEQLNFVTYLATTCFNTASSNSTTTSDREYVLNRHQERLVNLTCRLLNPVINSIHQLHNAVFPLCNTVQCTESRTNNNRRIFLISIRSKKVLNVHLYEVDHFFVNFWVIALVQENNQTRYVYLTSEQYVLTCLRHRTVSSSNNKDSTVHLSSTSYHVLYIVGVSGTVNVSIMTFTSFILNVCCVDGNTTFLLFRSIVNLIE